VRLASGITGSAQGEIVVLPDFSVVEGEYFRDLMDQPGALEHTVAGLEVPVGLESVAARVHKGEFRIVILTGMGSSFHALQPLQLELIRQGILAITVETSELIHNQNKLLSPDTLLVAVSQSGQSAEVVRLLKLNRGKSPLVAITNTADSPLAKQADAAILTRAGKEFSVSCKTYVTALAGLKWLGDVVCQRDLRHSRRELLDAAPSVREYLENWKQHVRGFLEHLDGVRHLFLVGRGASLAAVGTGALIIKESTHFPAEGMSSAAFRHGPFEMLGDEILVLIFAGAKNTRDLNTGLLGDIGEQRGRAVWVGEDATFAPCVLPVAPLSIEPILEILPVQMITLALAVRAGREPGRFSLATKVTTKE
jgi:glucosamine--fructose-6-phosphate aminotransferase (isomerizing)